MKEYSDPRMHTAEHILNQTMVRMFGCGRCFSSHVEKKKSKCDYRFPRNLTESETREIERRVNAVIAQDLPVTEETTTREAAESLFDLSRLPETTSMGAAGADVPGASVRIVRIGDYDACPCIGAHVASSSAVGTFSISSTSFSDGVLRIRFRLHP
jgi:misacylated tRNA(Ala) deacylase